MQGKNYLELAELIIRDDIMQALSVYATKWVKGLDIIKGTSESCKPSRDNALRVDVVIVDAFSYN